MSDNKQNPDNNFAMIGGGILAGMMALGLLLLVARPASGSFLWQWLATETLSPSETMRNYGLIAAGFIGLILAYWRAHTADRDNRIAQEAHRREISKIDQERFQTGAVALGSESMTVRIAAISSLARLATEQKSSFHRQTVALLEAFARDRSEQMREKNRASQLKYPSVGLPTPEDITHTVKTLLHIHSGNKSSKLTLHDLYLRKSALTETTFDNCDVSGSDLTAANLAGSTFNNSKFYHTIFSSCFLNNVNFLNSDFLSSDFSYFFSREISFRECHLMAVTFEGADLEEGKFHECLFVETNISNANFEKAEFVPQPETGLAAWAHRRPLNIPLEKNSIKLYKPRDEKNPGDLLAAGGLPEMSWTDAEAKYPQKGLFAQDNSK